MSKFNNQKIKRHETCHWYKSLVQTREAQCVILKGSNRFHVCMNTSFSSLMHHNRLLFGSNLNLHGHVTDELVSAVKRHTFTLHTVTLQPLTGRCRRAVCSLKTELSTFLATFCTDVCPCDVVFEVFSLSARIHSSATVI